MIESRYGVILFPRRDDVEFDLKNRQLVFQKVIPIRSILDESRFNELIDQMLCWSEEFDIIKEGERYPEYRPWFEKYFVDPEDPKTEKFRVTKLERVL